MAEEEAGAAEPNADMSANAEVVPPPPPPPHDVSESSHDESSEHDLISHQTEQKDNNIYQRLVEGFEVLQEARMEKKKPLFANPAAAADNQTSGTNKRAHLKNLLSVVTVNFIDPTTKNAPISSPKVTNMLSQQQVTAAPVIENVYDKITYLFERDFRSTLRSVQYKNMRSGESDVISGLPVQTLLTRTGGGVTAGSGQDANVPWGGTAGTAAAPVSDPSEWHNGPYCHVYIAACENMEHYKAKIRPSLQAFVSQIESAASTGGTSGRQGGNSAHYLIVYVPTGPRDSARTESEATAQSSGPVRRAFANRFQKARQRIADYRGNEEMENGSQHSNKSSHDSDGAGETGLEDEEEAGGVFNMLSRNERALYTKIDTDFPNGKVCVLSPDSLTKQEDTVAISSAGFAARTQEWSAFCRMLGSVIVSGFKDRCRRYNEELRRLDAQRAAAATASKSSKLEKNKNPSAVFNLSYFFLVKESLAFTYEQMQLPSEALLQYDEFRAFLPDLTEKEAKKAKKARRKSKTLAADDSLPPLVELADAGDYVNFRRKIRSEFDLIPIVDIIRRYLFARELCLLFKMEQPVQVISRCETFSQLMYSLLLRDASELAPELRTKRERDAVKWVVQFSWDVRTACESYLTSLNDARHQTAMRTDVSVETPGTEDLLSQVSDTEQTEIALAARVSELLEGARLLLKDLGDTELEGGNPLRAFENKLPVDLFQPWQPWKAIEAKPNDEKENVESNPDETTGRKFLIPGTFESPQNFEKRYLELTEAVITFSQFGDRRRIASRLQSEIAEYHIRKGNLATAAVLLKSFVKLYKKDTWDRLHFYLLFRLAYCQRTTASPTDYLKTLVTCFTPRTSAAAPPKALNALQNDLEIIIGHPVVGEAKYGRLPFIETDLKVVETSSDQSSTMGKGVDEKQLIKRYCSVGDKVQILLNITSHLPRPIELSSLRVFIVPSSDFAGIIENRESIEEEDAFRIIGLDSSAKLQPGVNNFSFEWEPSSAGQFILSTVEVKWKEGFFYYDSMDLPVPLLGVDVLPSEPQHSLTLEPKYLVPGHDQQVQITFDAGSDLITAAKISIHCSEGLMLIPPGDDPADGSWKKNCDVQLEMLKPGEKKVLTTLVRSGFIENFSHDSVSQVPSLDSAHGLNVKAITTYLHSKNDEKVEPENTPTMKSVVDAFAPILEKTALSVESAATIWVKPFEKLILSIDLMSNTPDHFWLEKFHLVLPPPLQVEDDLNQHLLKCAVADGDQLALAFRCIVGDGKDSKAADEASLEVMLKDDSGKEYLLSLELDLNDFYLKLLESSPAKQKVSSTVKANLRVESEECVVGETVPMAYTVDIQGLLQSDRQLVYSIVTSGNDWLLGGKINGVMDEKGSCEFIGIPLKPGQINRYPKIALGYCSPSDPGAVSPVEVQFLEPPPFQAHSKLSEVGIAFPSSK